MTLGEYLTLVKGTDVSFDINLLDGRRGVIFAYTAAGVLRVHAWRGEAYEEINIMVDHVVHRDGMMHQESPGGLNAGIKSGSDTREG